MNRITLILVVLTYVANANYRNRKEDKLLLSPIELIDLVRKEQHKYNRVPMPMKQPLITDVHSEKPNKQLEPEDESGKHERCNFDDVSNIFR